MSDSELAVCTVLSPNTSGRRTREIERITIHCVVGQCTAASLGAWFATPGHWSSNYGVGRDGSIGLYVPEDTVSQCSSSYDNDNRAVTIETASDNFYPYAVTAEAYAALLDLCEDVCRRNGKTRMVWLPTKEQRAACQPGAGEMLMTVHRDYANKSCPGEYLYSRMGEIAEAVNGRLAGDYPSSGLRPPSPQGEGSDKEEDGMRYNTIEELPEWGRETVVKLCRTGVIKGRSGETDVEGCPVDLDLSDDMLRLLVWNDRAGLYDWQPTIRSEAEAALLIADDSCGAACDVYDDYTMIARER
jgi:hypothetical protein